ncbi:MAG: radical SAM protein [Endomicrobiia bacterium]|nr:radical SAM protein [Endomicrobiia bacterium]
MTKKILLLSPPYVAEYMRNARCDFVSLSATQWYPLLLGYCGAYLEGKGYDVKLIDAPADYLTHAATEKIALEYRPDLIVLYTGRMSEENDISFGEALKEKLNCDCVIAGPFASINPENTLNASKTIDKLIVGEFDRAVADVAAGLKYAGIKNLAYKQNGVVSKNPLRPYMTGEELDAIPFVSRFFKKHVDIYRYKTSSELYPFMDIFTGRGCQWGLCTFCLWVHTYIRGRTYNLRSIENVIEEFRAIETEMPMIRSVMIQDDTFTEERAADFCEAKLKAGIKLPWSCYARANMSYDVLKLMKKSGCRNLHVGYESAAPEVLKRIKKGVTVEQMTKFTADAKRAGLGIHGDFAIGFPGETVESVKKTINWAYEMNPHTAQFQIIIPFPGTALYAEMSKNGWLNNDGQPDMPQLSNAEIRNLARAAYRKFYLSPKYLWKCIRHPHDFFFGRLKTIVRAIPALFWKKWTV